jgi:hypothetical protein
VVQWSQLSPELQATMLENQLVTGEAAADLLNAPPSDHVTAHGFVKTRATGMKPSFMCMGAGTAATGYKSQTDVSAIDVGRAERERSATFEVRSRTPDLPTEGITPVEP